MPSGAPDLDRIIIPGLPLRARVGVTEEERAVEQELRIAMTLHLDLEPAGSSDDLARTVDYDAVCATAERVVRARPFRLIESVAEEVAGAVLADFAVTRVDVRVEKPGALRARGVDFAAVEIERDRDA